MCKKCNIDEYRKDYEDLWEDMSDFYDNDELDDIEGGEYFGDMFNEFADNLKEQRNDIINSWLVRSIYNGLGQEILDRIESWEESKEDTKKLKEYIAGQASKKMNTITDDDFKKMIGVYLLYVATQWGQSIFNQVGIDSPFVINSVAFQKIIMDRVALLGKGLDQTTTKRMAENILEWMRNWYSIDKLNAELKKLGSELVLDRAGLIMTTETNSMLQFSRGQVAKTIWAGQKIRHATWDEKMCSICWDMDWAVIGIDEFFTADTWDGSAHPSCRCWIEFIFPDGLNIDNIDLEGF